MKFFFITFLFLCALLKSQEGRIWDAHSAYVIPEKRWEVGLFQAFRYGYSEGYEYSTHPIWFFIVPNLSIKKSSGEVFGHKTARRFKGYYPTPLLNMVSKAGIGGLIDPGLTIPPLVGLSGSVIGSRSIYGFDYSISAGADIGITSGELDYRSNIDLPMIYHRMGVFFNGWGLSWGLDIQKKVKENIRLHVDFDIRLLPGLSNKNSNYFYNMFNGESSLEHKFLIIWSRSNNFRIITGYKLVTGQFPYGVDTRVLPYIPMLEQWVPILELQWAGKAFN